MGKITIERETLWELVSSLERAAQAGSFVPVAPGFQGCDGVSVRHPWLSRNCAIRPGPACRAAPAAFPPGLQAPG